MTNLISRVAYSAVLVGGLGAFAQSASAQRPGRDFQQYFGDPSEFYVPPQWHGNPMYDGRVTFIRIKYRGYAKFTNEGPGWSHDYPLTETHFQKIMKEITTMRPFVEAPPIYGSGILTFEDPQLFKFPVAYLSEPGGWNPTETELAGFKKYISRGGFIVFDDMGWQVGNADISHLVGIWQRAFPKLKLTEIPKDHAIFNSFFKIDFTKVQGYYAAYGPVGFYGYFEDNDPNKRLLAVINNNNDLGEYMEFSEQGFNVTPTNEAYKLAVNYFVYALTH